MVTESPYRLVVGKVIVEPVDETWGDVIRDVFVRAGRCACGLEFEPPSRHLRRRQWRTGDVIEHVYRHAAGCPGGEHTVLDFTYRKEGV